MLKFLLVFGLLASSISQAAPMISSVTIVPIDAMTNRRARLLIHGSFDQPEADGRIVPDGAHFGVIWVRYPGRDWAQVTADRMNPVGMSDGWRPNYRGVYLFELPSAIFDVRVCTPAEGCSNPFSARHLPSLLTSDGSPNAKVGSRSLSFSMRDADYGPFQFMIGNFVGSTVQGSTYTGYPISVTCSSSSSCTADLPPQVLSHPGVWTLTASGPLGSTERDLFVEVWGAPNSSGTMPAKLGGSSDVAMTFVFPDVYSIPEGTSAVVKADRCAAETISIAKTSDRTFAGTIPGKCLSGFGDSTVTVEFKNLVGTGVAKIPYSQIIVPAPVPPRPTPTRPVPAPTATPTFAPRPIPVPTRPIG